MTPGQIAILDAWLSQYSPSETFDTTLDHVHTTEEIVADLSDMADWELNEVADHIAAAGFRFHANCVAGPHGWILRVKQI